MSIGDMSYLGPVGCPIVNILLDLCLIVSEFNITLFTIERFIAICHPLKAQRLSSKSRTFKLIAFIWVLGAAFCAPLLYFYVEWRTICIVWTGMNETESLPPSTSNCWRGYENTAQAAVYTMTPVVIFITVFITITVLDILTAVGLRKSAKMCTANFAPAVLKLRHKRERSVVVMLVVTATVYFLCLFPYHLELIFTFYNYLQEDYDKWIITGDVWGEFVRWLPMVNSTINPIVYGLIGKQYRQAFKRALCFCGQDRRTRFFSENRRDTFSTSIRSSRRSRAESQNRAEDVQMVPIDSAEVRETRTKENVSSGSDIQIKIQETESGVNNNTKITSGQDSVTFVINALEVGQIKSKNTGDGFLRELDNIYF
ncbi:tachykinin-like peptides receptor 86C [Saccoglossus kowalevskii]|uniref:Tachykinin-like peptides receptor 86C-like n=1 Tax=Saccoglossus kowalevskii TaxID=10224 RepID=A0ABM0MFY8_SACKO|nr:PREDICTED: tachykinin-like peptides receptor 86C-like [Saccoglossus kowalevskii]